MQILGKYRVESGILDCNYFLFFIFFGGGGCFFLPRCKSVSKWSSGPAKVLTLEPKKPPPAPHPVVENQWRFYLHTQNITISDLGEREATVRLKFALNLRADLTSTFNVSAIFYDQNVWSDVFEKWYRRVGSWILLERKIVSETLQKFQIRFYPWIRKRSEHEKPHSKGQFRTHST